MKNGNATPYFETIVLGVTSVCNLGCIYCQPGPFMNMLPTNIMPKSLVTKIMSEVIPASLERSQESIEFCFSGGEPLLAGLDFFHHAARVQKHFNANQKLRITNVLQTNGMLLSDDTARFIRDNDFRVSVSIDGYQSIQDSHRPMLGGGESFSKVMRGIETLKAHDIEFGLIGVITEDSALRADTILPFLLSLEPRLIALLPCVDRGPKISGDGFARFMVDGFDLWMDPSTNPNSIPVRTFRDICLHLFGMPISKVCDYYGECPRHPTIAADGTVAVCDQYFGKEEGYLGNVNEESLSSILDSPRTLQFLQYSKELPECCTDCAYLSLCNGGCVYRRSRNHGVDYFCSARQRLFAHIKGKIEDLLDMRGEPSEQTSRLINQPL